MNLLDDVVAAIVERDKLPQLTPDTLDPAKYATPEAQQQAIAARVTERKPFQDKVDKAVTTPETFDSNHPAPQPAADKALPPAAPAPAGRDPVSPAQPVAGDPSALTPPAAPRDPAPPMTPDEIVAATTAADRALLNRCTQVALQGNAVQQAVRDDNPAAFDTAFHTALGTAISDASPPDQVPNLSTLHADPVFRAGLTTLVWTQIAPAMRAEQRTQPPAEQPTTAAAAAAAVAAQAFLPAGAGAASSVAPTSPPPARAPCREPVEARSAGER